MDFPVYRALGQLLAEYYSDSPATTTPVSYTHLDVYKRQLTTSIKVLFSTSSCIGHRLLSADFAGVAFNTKAGPPAAAVDISRLESPFSAAGRNGHSIDAPGAPWHD